MEESDVEQWRHHLRETFGQLAPDSEGAPTGEMSHVALGSLLAYRVSGTPQVLRRTAAAVRTDPIDRLKLCLSLTGTVTVSQNNRQVTIGPRQMALYDTARPYDLRLEQGWSCIVLAFPRDALSLPNPLITQAMGQVHAIDQGPGAVLANFVGTTVEQQQVLGGSGGRLGEAGLHLIAGALGPGEAVPAEAADAQRLQILGYVREHLSDPDLTHDRVAAAHRMAPRTLHRLFDHEPRTVTEYIRFLRLQSARLELTDPLLRHLTIARIAARWCFSSQAHFTRAFQAQYGQLPSVVRPTLDPPS